MTQLLDAILTTSPIVIVGLDESARINAWSVAAAGHFGVPAASALGTLFVNLLSPQGAAALELMLAAAADPGVATPALPYSAPIAGWQVIRLGTRDMLDGYCVTIRPAPSPFEVTGFGAEVHRIFFEQLPALSYISRGPTALEPELLLLSPQYDMAFGYPMSTWQRHRAERGSVVHPDERETRRDIIDNLPAGSNGFTLDYRLIAAESSIHWVRERARRYIDPTTGHTYWVGFVIDISAEKEAESNAAAALAGLREANERLAQLNAVKTDFVATISHEFRTPLTSILGFSELLQVEGLVSDEIATFARTINENAARMARMISSVLDLQALEAGERQIRREPLDLVEIVRRVHITVLPLAPQHGFALDLPAGVPQVMGDPEMIEQVITNVIANAIKYSPEGGTITVALRRRADDLELTVADQGLGVPIEHRERIFSRYGRIVREEQVGIEGTGLGLPIARHILEVHNGRIWVEANTPRGSIFHIILPLQDAAPDELATWRNITHSPANTPVQP